ncbi:DUF2933 domain-containing protein [Variovorax rhizosphaerae]|uniref:DUF2933 domain-containing protein n=1 Tax=Variovorax rhizosphaerae TaxID=1836200 RepID=UPI003BF57B6C
MSVGMLIGGLFLYAEHRADLFGVLPLLLLAACPLIREVMHRGHCRANPDRARYPSEDDL